LKNWEKLPDYPEDAKIDSLKVNGCTAQVWLLPVIDTDNDQNVYFCAESDAAIVRGLIAILMVVYQGQSSEFITQFNIETFFAKIGLDEALSPNRRNGFFSMVSRIKKINA